MARGTIALYCVWLLSVAILLAGDRQNGYAALGIGAIVALLVATDRWTLPSGSNDPEGALRQEGTAAQLAFRGVVAIGLVAWMMSMGLALAVHVPIVSDLQRWASSVNTGLPRGGLSLWVTGTCVLVPLSLLLALGARPAQLGLRWSSGGDLRLLLWIAAPIGIMIWRVTAGYLSVAGLLALLAENFMLNGLPEEFVFRGVLLSYCRRILTTDWAFLIQAVLFSLLHYGVTIGEEHGRVALIVANVIATNVPFAFLFGLMALRSRSIAMGSIVHFMLDSVRAATR